MAGTLDETDVARLERTGIQPLATGAGLELFEHAQRLDPALLVPVRLDLGALRTQATAGTLPALLRGLVRVPPRRVEVTASLAQRLAGVAEAEREQVVLQVVRSQVAAVLGHASPGSIDANRSFKELGFDSLGAVELRNRLTQASGVRLAPTLVFDHPTSLAVARLLLAEVGGAGAAAEPPVDATLRALEGLLTEAGTAERQRVAGRLRTLLAAMTDAPPRHTSELIEAATTADEVFELFDAEFGEA
jgi:acyl carrier protein